MIQQIPVNGPNFARPSVSHRLSRLTLGPKSICGHSVSLRQPRLDDFAEWRRIRLRDQQLIEPYWASSPVDWVARHSEQYWVREWLTHRRNARLGRSVSLVIEADGRFAGQCELSSIAQSTRSAEFGIWADAQWARRGVAGLAGAMLVDFAFDALGLERITAPISPENVAASRSVAVAGHAREALMLGYLCVGGERKDHVLWSAVRDAKPPGGYAKQWIERFESRHADRSLASYTTHRHGQSRPRAAVVAATTVRLCASRAWHRVHRLHFRRSLKLDYPHQGSFVLRSRRLSDFASWYAALSRYRTASDTGLPAVQKMPNRRTARLLWLRDTLQSRHGQVGQKDVRFVVEVEGSLVGECTLFDIDLFQRNASMHVWLDPALGDLTIASAAAKALLEYALGTAGMFRVSMAVEAGNACAEMAAKGAGMIREGTMRHFVGPDGRLGDHELWAITATTAAHAHQ